MPDWMTIRIELVEGKGTVFASPPGRTFLVGPAHTFGDLAHAINLRFARWDISHLHEFRLGDGREIGFPDPDAPRLPSQNPGEVAWSFEPYGVNRLRQF